MSASWGWMETSVTSQTRHPMLPVHHMDCLVSRFLPENVSIVTKSLFDCWHGHFVAQGPDYKMLTRFLDFTHGDHKARKLAPVTSERWWMPVIQCLIFKGDGNLQSIMFTMNVSILPALHHQATWRWWNDVVGTPSTLIIIRSASLKKVSMLVFRNMLWSFCWNVVNVPA